MIWRFIGATSAIFVVALITIWGHLAPALHGRPIAASIWLGIAGFALVMGVLVAVVELALNAMLFRRGQIERREWISLLDCWPF